MINLLPSRFYCQLTNNHWRSHLCIHMFISLSGCEDHGGDVYWWRRGENFLPLRAFIWYRQPSLLEAPGQSPQVSICPGFISTEQATLSIACGPQQLEALWFEICLFFFFLLNPLGISINIQDVFILDANLWYAPPLLSAKPLQMTFAAQIVSQNQCSEWWKEVEEGFPGSTLALSRTPDAWADKLPGVIRELPAAAAAPVPCLCAMFALLCLH